MPEEELKPIEQRVRFFKFGLIKDFAKEIRKDQPKKPAFSKAVLPPETGPAGKEVRRSTSCGALSQPNPARARRTRASQASGTRLCRSVSRVAVVSPLPVAIANSFLPL